MIPTKMFRGAANNKRYTPNYRNGQILRNTIRHLQSGDLSPSQKSLHEQAALKQANDYYPDLIKRYKNERANALKHNMHGFAAKRKLDIVSAEENYKKIKAGQLLQVML